MQCYLTAPTVPAAVAGASGTTAIPTGILTIYNGSAWVCITEVGAYTYNNGTRTGSTAIVSTLTGDATAVSVTISTGTTAMITWGADCYATVTSSAVRTYVAVSGATTIAATDDFATAFDSNSIRVTATRSQVLSGLTAGINTFTLNYGITNSSAIGTWDSRYITVKGIA
jgi:hypothetical protein